MSRSAESKFDPVVANLTPSQKRQITQLYGGGDPPSGGKWEPGNAESDARPDKTRDGGTEYEVSHFARYTRL